MAPIPLRSTAAGSSAGSGLTISLLGPPRIECGGRPIEVDTRKAIALLAYLAVTPGAHGRDSLAALLWPEYDQASARGSLRRTLSTLRKALAGEWLEVTRDQVALPRRDGLAIDVDLFRERLAEAAAHGHAAAGACPARIAPLAAAVELYRGEFLAGFTLRESPNFDDWQLFESGVLRREFSGALERLVDALSAVGELERAITYTRRWLAQDVLHEPAHRRLMQLYAWIGDRAAALRQYRECVRVLEAELGVAPLAETTQLSEALREDRLPPRPRPLPVVDPPAAAAPPSDGAAGNSRAPAAALPTDRRSPDTLKVDGVAPRRHSGSYPLVGRDREWAALLAAYNAGPAGHLVVIEGEAGIGKTRMAEELLAHAQSQGGRVLTTRCYDGEAGLAYAPFTTALRTLLASDEAGHRPIAEQGGVGNLGHLVQAVRTERRGVSSQIGTASAAPEVADLWLSEATRLVPELAALRPGAPPAPPLDGPGAQTRFFEGVCQVLVAGLRHRSPAPQSGAVASQGILFVDDVHWADEASLDLLAYLVRRLAERPVLALVTWRTESVPGTHRLRRMLADAERRGQATALRLARLGADDVAALARAAIGLSSPGAAVEVEALLETLYLETEGVPFFVVEFLSAVAAGGPQSSTGLGSGESTTGGAEALLRSRLTGLSDTALQLLTTAAVIGRSFDFDTVRAASGRSEDEAVAALEDLTARGLVREVARAGTTGLPFDFTHHKLREYVYLDASLTRRRLLHRRAAEALLGHTHSSRELGTLAAQVARHYQLAGQDAEAARHFASAAEHARRLYANAEALAHYRLALALGHPDVAQLHEAIGDLQTLAGEYGAAQESYEVAAAHRPALEQAELEHKLGDLYRRRGEWDLAESHFQAALGSLQYDGADAERSRLLADRSLIAHRRNQPARAVHLAQESLALAERVGDTRALAQAHNLLGILAKSSGDLEAAHQQLERSLSLAEELADPGVRAAALNNLALVCGAAGQFERALELTQAALALCTAQGDRHREAAVHNNLADLLHAAGRTEAAMAHLKRAVAIFAEIGARPGAAGTLRLEPEIWRLAEW